MLFPCLTLPKDSPFASLPRPPPTLISCCPHLTHSGPNFFGLHSVPQILTFLPSLRIFTAAFPSIWNILSSSLLLPWPLPLQTLA